MTLMERVAALLRANANDLLDRAEDPEKAMKQLVLDMENQLLQLKTQVATALADQHLLERKKSEHDAEAAEWKQKAEVAMEKQREDLARVALSRSVSHAEMAASFAEQLAHQAVEAESLRGSYLRLQQKLKETEAQCEVLIAQHRRAKTVERANQMGAKAQDRSGDRLLRSVRDKVQGSEARNAASATLLQAETMEGELIQMEREDKIEKLLEEMKRKQGKMLSAG